MSSKARLVPAAIGLTLVAGWSLVHLPALTALLVPAILGILGLIALVKVTCDWDEDGFGRSSVLRWTMLAFLLHLGIGLAIANSAGATTYFGPDARTYHFEATQLAAAWAGHGLAPHLAVGKEGFSYLLGFFYYLFGPHNAAGVAINAALAAALVPLLTDLTRRLAGARAARYIAPLIVLLPGFLVWTSQLLREAGTLFFLAVIMYCAVLMIDHTRPGPVFFMATALALLLTFRSNVAYVLAPVILVGVVLGKRQLGGAVAAGVSTVTVLLLLVFSLGIGYSGYRYASGLDLKQANRSRLDAATSAQSGYTPTTDISTPKRALSALPTSLVAFLLGPFPWQVGSPRQLAGLAEVACLWALVPSFLRGLRILWRRSARQTYVFLLPALVLAGMLSLFLGNFGNVIRERLQVLIFLIPITAIGLAERQRVRTPASPSTSASLSAV